MALMRRKKGAKLIPVGSWIRRNWLEGVSTPKVAQIPALVVLGFFIVLSSFGITNSSIGIGVLTETAGANSGVIVGTPRDIRSDEYMRTTPWRLGTLRRAAEDYQSPLTLDPFYAVVATPNDGVAEYVVYLDAAAVELLGPLLPDAFIFSLYWWLPTILVFLALPRWLEMLGVRRSLSWLATLLIVFSPAVAWWSMWPLRPLAWALLAGLLLVRAVDIACSRRRVGLWPIVLAVVSGIFLAKTALAYFPWALSLGVSVLVPTLPFVVARDHMRRRMLLLGIAAGVGLLASAMVLVENWEAVMALSNTVYPGARRTSGSAVNPGLVYGAQHLGILRQDPILVATNQSELSAAYTLLVVPAVVLLIALPRSAWGFARTRATAGSLIAILGLFFIWISIDIPRAIGESVPGMNRIDPQRLAQVIGIPIVFLFAIALDRFDRFSGDRIPRWMTILIASILTFSISVWAGVLLKSTHVPDLRLRSIALVSIVFGALVALVIARPDRLSSLASLAAGAVAVVVLANPVMMGFGELVDGQAAEFVRSQSQDARGPIRWTSDNASSDALLMANALPSLSGQQWVASEEAWIALDQDQSHVDAWNRGVASILVVPTVGLEIPEIESPFTDVIVVRVDPCDSVLDVFQVTHMIASEPIESSCLTEIGSFDFGGASRLAYRRSSPEAD